MQRAFPLGGQQQQGTAVHNETQTATIRHDRPEPMGTTWTFGST